jgi:glycerophosphoryl diester phosphodiesterase
MCGNDHFLALAQRLYPDIHRCCGAGAKPWEIVERGIQYGCCKVQLFKPYFNQQMIDKAHANGIRCNVFYADEVEEAKQYLSMGIDTILTNDYLKIANATKEIIHTKRK